MTDAVLYLSDLNLATPAQPDTFNDTVADRVKHLTSKCRAVSEALAETSLRFSLVRNDAGRIHFTEAFRQSGAT